MEGTDKKGTPVPGIGNIKSEFSSGRGTGLGTSAFPKGSDIKASELKDANRAVRAGASKYPTSGGTTKRTPPEALFGKDRIQIPCVETIILKRGKKL